MLNQNSDNQSKKPSDKKRIPLNRDSYSLNILKQLVRTSITFIEKRDVIFSDVYDQIIEELNNPRRNLLKLYLLLQSYPNFKYFLNAYMIPQVSMMECIKWISLYKFKTGQHVFNLGDQSDNFYIIIRGNVIVKELVLKGGGYIIRDKLRLFTGDCFGETAVLYDLNRSNTIVSETDTTMLGIPKTVFIQNLKSVVLRAERKKRQQICALIPILAEIPFRQFIQIYKNFVFLSFKKCTYIFREGEKAEAFYLITNGRVKLIKGQYNIMTIGKNCLTGFEAVDFVEFDNEVPYQTSLLAVDDCSVIKIRVGLLGSIYEKFINIMRELKKKKDYFIKNTYQKAKNEKEKFFFDYHEKKIYETLKLDNEVKNEKIIEKEYKNFCIEEEKNKDLKKQYHKVKEKVILRTKSRQRHNITSNIPKPKYNFKLKLKSPLSTYSMDHKYNNNSYYSAKNISMYIKTIQPEDEHSLFEKKMNHLFITTNPNLMQNKKTTKLINRGTSTKTLPGSFFCTLASTNNDRSHPTISNNNNTTEEARILFSDTPSEIKESVNNWSNALKSNCNYDTGKYKFPLICMSSVNKK